MKKFGSMSFLAAVALFGLGLIASADEKAKSKIAPMDRLKSLAGEWSGKADHGDQKHEATVSYKVTSGGTAVMETLGPGTEHEMVTVFHQDGDSIALTHYCMIGNQPRMKAEKNDDSKKLSFKFTGAGNLKSDRDAHMHDLTIEFLADDHIKSTWTFYKDGKEDSKATFDMKRKK
jgi:hypothetical protein